jgi:GrpB-like predicted nucleotidyltransferase (UPF0157 family)
LGRDPKTELQQLFQSHKRVPRYHVLSVSGPDHARSYEVEVRLDGHALARGAGRSKKEAEQAAARAALEVPGALEHALIDEPVAVQGHDAHWAELYAAEAARLESALGEAALAIEHVGSTAVPGLDASPIVDLLVGVAALDPALRLPDYEACGPAGVPGRLYFRKRGPASFNAQVVVHGGPIWRAALLLRDYLRAHPEEAQRYASHKRESLARGATTSTRYSEEKAPLITELLQRAEAWASS